MNTGKNDKRDSRFVGIVKQYLFERHMTLKDLAPRIGMCYNTMTVKINHPEKFTVAEMRRICDLLRIPADERNFI